MKPVVYIVGSLLTVTALLSVPASAQKESQQSYSRPLIADTNFAAIREAVKEVTEGNLCFTNNAPRDSIEHYQKAATIWPNGSVYIGLGKAYVALGDYKQALAAYRTLYDEPSLKARGGEADAGVLLHYALTLSKMGYDAEALVACRRGLRQMQESGVQTPPVPLPDMGDERINRFVSRSKLQAVAHIGILLSENPSFFPEEQKLHHARAAAEAQPQADWIHFYYGQTLAKQSRDTNSAADRSKAKGELELAARLGDKATKTQVEDFLNEHPAIGLK